MVNGCNNDAGRSPFVFSLTYKHSFKAFGGDVDHALYEEFVILRIEKYTSSLHPKNKIKLTSDKKPEPIFDFRRDCRASARRKFVSK